METETFPEDSFSFLDIIHENGFESGRSCSEYIIRTIAIERKRTEKLYSRTGPREIEAIQVLKSYKEYGLCFRPERTHMNRIM